MFVRRLGLICEANYLKLFQDTGKYLLKIKMKETAIIAALSIGKLLFNITFEL